MRANIFAAIILAISGLTFWGSIFLMWSVNWKAGVATILLSINFSMAIFLLKKFFRE